jgi:hypothetical protein
MNDLQIYDTLEQGSDEWLQARCGILTASVIGKMLTPKLQVANNETSRTLTETLVAERLTGHVEFIHPSRAMERGTLDEPYARQMYAENHAPVEQIGFATNVFNGHVLGASPDGLVSTDGGIEIKSRDPKIQLRTILTQEVPAENLAQVHTSMLVLDREWWDYCSYAGGWPLVVIRVYRDEAWHLAIRDALDAFEERAAAMASAYRRATAGEPIAPRIDHFAETEMSF